MSQIALYNTNVLGVGVERAEPTPTPTRDSWLVTMTPVTPTPTPTSTPNPWVEMMLLMTHHHITHRTYVFGRGEKYDFTN